MGDLFFPFIIVLAILGIVAYKTTGDAGIGWAVFIVPWVILWIIACIVGIVGIFRTWGDGGDSGFGERPSG